MKKSRTIAIDYNELKEAFAVLKGAGQAGSNYERAYRRALVDAFKAVEKCAEKQDGRKSGQDEGKP